MKTRFSPIVKFKYSVVQKSEARLQEALLRLHNAKEALEASLSELERLGAPHSGNMQEFLASRSLLDAQMRLIEKNREWVAYEQRQVDAIKEQLKADMIEYEKFKYLEAEEIKKMQKSLKLKESKRLDEVAMMTFKKEAV